MVDSVGPESGRTIIASIAPTYSLDWRVGRQAMHGVEGIRLFLTCRRSNQARDLNIRDGGGTLGHRELQELPPSGECLLRVDAGTRC